MEKISLEYECDLRDQVDKEVEEQAQMKLEEKYNFKLLTAHAKFYFKTFKEKHLLEVEYWRRKAIVALRKHRAETAAHEEHYAKLEAHSDELDLAAYRKILPAIAGEYQRHGMARVYPEEEKLRRPDNIDPQLSSNYLRPLPPHQAMSSINKFTKYINKGKQGPPRDLDEGFAIDSLAAEDSEEEVEKALLLPSLVEGAAPIQTGVRLELAVDPATLDPEKQQLFLQELARLVHVHPDIFVIRKLNQIGLSDHSEGEEGKATA